MEMLPVLGELGSSGLCLPPSKHPHRHPHEMAITQVGAVLQQEPNPPLHLAWAQVTVQITQQDVFHWALDHTQKTLPQMHSLSEAALMP